MPITSAILDNGYIVTQIVTDPWTTADLMQAGDFERRHLDSVNHTVHVLVDFSGSRSVPIDLLWVRREPSIHHPCFGDMVFVGAVIWLRIVLAISLRMMRFNRFGFFMNQDDALAFLRSKART